MKRWVTTSWMYQTFGQDEQQQNSKSNRWVDGYWTRTWHKPDYAGLESALNKLSDYCNRHQMAVKSMVPLTSAQTYQEGHVSEYGTLMNGVTSAAGLGFGWGFSNVIGFAALLERVEEISDEEYERRCMENVPTTDSPGIAPPPLPAVAV